MRMSNALMIDSFGSRSRRKRITASTQREGAAPSFAQRSASLASIVTRCRLSPRRSWTITLKVNPLPRQGVTVTEGSLISLLCMAALSIAACPEPSHNTLNANPDDKLLAAQTKSYRRSSGSATPLPPCPQRSAVVARCLRVQVWQLRRGDFLPLLGNQLD